MKSGSQAFAMMGVKNIDEYALNTRPGSLPKLVVFLIPKATLVTFMIPKAALLE